MPAEGTTLYQWNVSMLCLSDLHRWENKLLCVLLRSRYGPLPCYPSAMSVYDTLHGSPNRLNVPRMNEIVPISRNLNREEREPGFQDCLLKE